MNCRLGRPTSSSASAGRPGATWSIPACPGGILHVGIDDVIAGGDLLGTMIETFVIAQLQAQSAVSDTRYRLSHLRKRDGRRKVDVIAELAGGQVVGVEIKARGQPRTLRRPPPVVTRRDDAGALRGRCRAAHKPGHLRTG